MKIFLLAASALALAMPAQAQTSRFNNASPDTCQESRRGQEGAVAYRCPSAPAKLELFYVDGRMYVSIGDSEMFGPFDSAREPSWVWDWRGSGSGAFFNPYAVVVRMRRPYLSGEYLVVFAEGRNGWCLADEVTSSERAREIADSARNHSIC